MANREGQPEKFINDRVSKYSQDDFRANIEQVKGYPLTTEYIFALAYRLFFSVKDPNFVSRL